MSVTDISLTTRELDRRTSDGIDVRLLWSPDTNHVSIAVTEEDTGAALTFVVAGADALTAFKHALTPTLSTRWADQGVHPLLAVEIVSLRQFSFGAAAREVA